MDRDADGDGMPSGWETRFGLLPADGTDAAGDADGDGVNNLAEYQRGSHADKRFTRYLAEGAANGFLTTQAGAGQSARRAGGRGAAAARLERESRDAAPDAGRPLARHGHVRRGVGDAPENDFATVIESKQPIVVDRTMTWDARRYGAHAETSIEAPATTWYLAEGATHGNFDLFYLLLNATRRRRDRDGQISAAVAAAADRQDLHGARERTQDDLGGRRRARSRRDRRLRRDYFRSADRRRTRDVFELGRRAVRGGHGGAGVTAPAHDVVPGGRRDRQLLRPLPADRQSRARTPPT